MRVQRKNFSYKLFSNSTYATRYGSSLRHCLCPVLLTCMHIPDNLRCSKCMWLFVGLLTLRHQ